MPFNYQAQPLPVLEPGQMNPFNQAVRSGLNTFQQGIKAGYTPQNMQADLEKKQAYVDYMKNMPMQYVSQVLSNPQLVPFLSNDQRNSLVDRMIQRAKQPEQNHGKDGLLNWIKNAFNSDSSAPQQSEQAQQSNLSQIPEMKPGDSYVVGSGKPPQQEPEENNLGKATGYTQVPPALPIQNNNASGSIDPSNPAANAYGRDFGSSEANRIQSKLNPSPAFSQQNKAQETEKKENARENVKLWNDELNNTRQEAKSAKSAIDQLTRFKNIYDKLLPIERGFPFGKGPAVSSNAQLADNISNNIALDLASERFKQRITNNDLQYSQTLKANRALNPNAEKDMVDFLTSANQRIIEQAAFKNAARNKGLTLPESDLVWQKYIDERPLYNTTTGKLEPKNAKGWSEFLSPQKIREALNPQNSYQNPEYVPPIPEKKSSGIKSDPLGIR